MGRKKRGLKFASSGSRVTQKLPGLDCPTPTKTAWATRKDAKRALRILRTRLDDDGERGKVQVYLCECKAFHIGHSRFRHRNPPAVQEAPPLETPPEAPPATV